MDDIELAWLAGWLEGEGTFRVSINRRSNPPINYSYARIQATTTDEDVAIKVAGLLDTKPSRGKPHGLGKCPVFYITHQNVGTPSLMLSLRPFICKRKQAQIDKALKLHALSQDR